MNKYFLIILLLFFTLSGTMRAFCQNITTVSTNNDRPTSKSVEFSFLNAKTDQGILTVVYYRNLTAGAIKGEAVYSIIDGKNSVIRTDSMQIDVPPAVIEPPAIVPTPGAPQEISFKGPLTSQDIYHISIQFHDLTGHIQEKYSEDFSTLHDFSLPIETPLVQKVAYIRENGFTNAPENSVKYNGGLGKRMKESLVSTLLHADEKELLKPYTSAKQSNLFDLEKASNFLERGSYLWKYHHDPLMKNQLDQIAYTIIHTTDSTGNLEALKKLNFSSVWNASQSIFYSNEIRGLLAYYNVFGYKPALGTAIIISKEIISKPVVWAFENDSNRNDHAMAGGLINTVVDLYRFSGISTELLQAKQLSTFYRPEHSLTQSLEYKSAELTSGMMAGKLYDLAGMVKIYRITAEKSYLNFASQAWLKLSSDAQFMEVIRGSGKSSDLVLVNSKNNFSRQSIVSAWMLLTEQLFASTAEMNYYGELEKLIYSKVLWNSAGVAFIPEVIFGKIDSHPVLLTYESGFYKQEISTSNGSSLALSLSANSSYPESGKVVLTIIPEYAASFSVLLRVPAWASNYKAVIGTMHYEGKVNTLLNIQRYWKPGDVIEISFDLPPSLSFGLIRSHRVEKLYFTSSIPFDIANDAH